jgi:hypothetical protein
MRGDELLWVVIHIYVEMSHENSLGSYLKKSKMVCFFFYKIREQTGRTGPAWGDSYQVSGEEVGKGYGRVNVVQILCTHVYK